MRAARYSIGGYCSGVDTNTWPRSKKTSEHTNESSITMSRVRSESSRRQSTRPPMKITHSATSTHGSTTLRP